MKLFQININKKMYNSMKLMLCVSIMVASISNYEANAKVFTFNYPADFDTLELHMQNGTYSTEGFAAKYDAVESRQYFQLTDTISNQGAILYHSEMLNLREEWVLNFKIRMGTGMNGKTVDPSLGIAFILTTNKYGAMYTPHSSVPFAKVFICEYDSHYGSNTTIYQPVEEGGDSSGAGKQHTAFLKNDSYEALPGTFAQMQNDYGKVTIDQWICCKLVYKKEGSGFRLENYIQELSTGQMVLRNSKYFATPSNLMPIV